MRRAVRLVVLVAALAAALAVASPALAGHQHWLETPGTCVENIARGQTAQTEGGGFHKFHENVHLGMPGAAETGAFANPNNPVSVGKGTTCP